MRGGYYLIMLEYRYCPSCPDRFDMFKDLLEVNLERSNQAADVSDFFSMV